VPDVGLPGRSWKTRVWKGVGSSALAQAIAATQAILLVPLFLRAWGSDGYGHWITLTTLVSYLSLLDFGAQNYIGNLLAARHARGQDVAFRKGLSEGVSFFVCLGLAVSVVLLISLLVAFKVPLPGLARPLVAWEVWVLALLGVNCLLLSIPGGVYVTAYRATGLFVRGAMMGNVVRFLGIGLSVGLLWASAGLEVYALSVLGTGLVLTSIIIWDTRRCIPECRSVDVSLAAGLRGSTHLRGAIYFWLLALAQTVKQQGVILILAAAATPAVVSLYATHRTIANIPGYFPVLVLGPLMPEFSFLWAQDRLSDLCRATFSSIRIVVIMTGAAAIFLWLSSPLIYNVWTSGRFELEPLLLAVLLVQGVLAAGWATSAWSLLASNRNRSVAMWSLLNAAITISLATFLVRKHGEIGVAVAGLIGDLVCGVAVFPALASAFLRVRTLKIYAEIGSGMLVLLTLLGVAMIVSVLLGGWLSVLAFMVVGAGLFRLIMFPAIGLADGGIRDVLRPLVVRLRS